MPLPQPPTHLQNSQLPQPPPDKLLPLPLIRLGMMFAEGISRPAPRVLAEVVGGELGGLPEEGAELFFGFSWVLI